MRKYFELVRDDLATQDGLLQKTDSLAETMMEMDITYPFYDSEVSLDSITGENNKDVWRELNKYAKRLSAKLADSIEPEESIFAMHHNYKVNGTGAKEAKLYMPFTLALGDGQVLTALVRNSSNARKYNAKNPLVVGKWVLNKADITTAIYVGGNTELDLATTVARIAKLIESYHKQFISLNPMADKGVDIASEIDGMVLDLSGVVKNEASEFNRKFDEMVQKKLDDGTSRVVDFDNREDANAFAVAYGRKTLRGHRVGGNSVHVDNLDDMTNAWIDSYMAGISMEIGKETEITQEDLDELNEGFDNPPKIVEIEAPTYTLNLPRGAEKYIPSIREEFAQDEKLKGLTYTFAIDGTVMDSVDKKDVIIGGGEKAIQTHMKKIIHFITIGADKVEGKDDAKMPSVDVIRNAEHVKEKTGLDYTIDHQQHATFLTAREAFDVGFDGKGSNYLRPIGKNEHSSISERWLGSDFSRKKITEYILEALAKENQGGGEPQTISIDEKSQLLGKAFFIGGQAFKNKEPESPMNNKTFHKFMTDNEISVHLSKDIKFDTDVTNSFNAGYDEAKSQSIRENSTDKEMTKRQKEDNPYLVAQLIKDYTKDKSIPNGTVYEILKLINPLFNAEDDVDREEIRKDIIEIFNDIMEEVKGFKNKFVFKEENQDTKTEETKPKTPSIKAKLKVIKPFMGKSQYKVISTGIDKEDYEFNDVINRLHETISTMPKIYGQDGMGDKAIAHLHYFNSGSDWYVTEKDTGKEQTQGFGYRVLNGDTQNAELGYISIEELTRLGVELDFHWSEKTLGEVKGKEDVGEAVDMETDKTYTKKIVAMEERKGQSIDEMVGSALESINIDELNESYENISSQFPDAPDSDTDPILKKIIELETEPKDYSNIEKAKEALSVILESEDDDILIENAEILETIFKQDESNEEIAEMYQKASERFNELAGV